MSSFEYPEEEPVNTDYFLDKEIDQANQAAAVPTNYFYANPNNRSFIMGKDQRPSRRLRKLRQIITFIMGVVGVLILTTVLTICRSLIAAGDKYQYSIDSIAKDAATLISFSFAVELCGALVLYALGHRLKYREEHATDSVLITGLLTSASAAFVVGLPLFYGLKIKYSFADPQTNQIYHAQSMVIRNDLRLKPLPKPKRPVYVLFLDEKHFELL